MSSIKNILQLLAKPTITTPGEFVRYVVLVNAFSLAVALTIDVAHQLVFFATWTVALRSWALTVFAVVVIATPVAMVVGRAQRELQLAKRTLEEMTRTDPLTGLLNRRALMEAGEAPAAQVMVLVIADIDHFKTVNDTYGHRAGDTALQTVGRLLAAHLTEYGLVGRLGGEEFAVISSVVSVEQIIPALRKALHAIAATPIVISGGTIWVTLSAGVAVRYQSEPFEKLYSDADEALYRAKRAGRNRIELSAQATDGCGPGTAASSNLPCGAAQASGLQ